MARMNDFELGYGFCLYLLYKKLQKKKQPVVLEAEVANFIKSEYQKGKNKRMSSRYKPVKEA